jgi:hypothetical protein
MSRSLISTEAWQSRAADSRWDRGIMTKGASTRERKGPSFCRAQGGVGGGEGGRGGCAGQELWSRKGEPAGNLKGKFAGWIALGLLVSSPLASRLLAPLAAWLSTAAPNSAISLPFRPFLTGRLSLSRFHKMDSPQDTPSTDHHDDQQAKSSYVAHIFPSPFRLFI